MAGVWSIGSQARMRDHLFDAGGGAQYTCSGAHLRKGWPLTDCRHWLSLFYDRVNYRVKLYTYILLYYIIVFRAEILYIMPFLYFMCSLVGNGHRRARCVGGRRILRKGYSTDLIIPHNIQHPTRSGLNLRTTFDGIIIMIL